VRARSVDFMSDAAGRVERLELAPEPARAAPPTPTRAPAPVGPEGDLTREVARSVRAVGEGRYQIDRGLIDRMMNDPSELGRRLSVSPAMRDGKAAGFRLREGRGGVSSPPSGCRTATRSAR
jgi:hypothetical protein